MIHRCAVLFAVVLGGCSEVLGIEEGVPQGSACDEPGAKMCDGYRPMQCISKRWQPAERECAHSCRDGECLDGEPPSCSLPTPCASGESCCETVWVRGGEFLLRYDGRLFMTGIPRTVSGFFLDRFEVTMVRFRQFVEAYPDSLPQPGQGAPPDLPHLGWRAEWATPETKDIWENPVVPPTREALEAWFAECEGSTYPDGLFTMPINCLNWYLAFAFCVWDGGRLPTEAEWQFAASYGDEQRVYPWSLPPHNEAISAENAWFEDGQSQTPSSPTLVGSKPAGRGGFHHGDVANAHEDLAGNVAEWVLDGDGVPSEAPCSDCANEWSTEFRLLRGGSYTRVGAGLMNAQFSDGHASIRHATHGVRCARDARTTEN